MQRAFRPKFACFSLMGSFGSEVRGASIEAKIASSGLFVPTSTRPVESCEEPLNELNIGSEVRLAKTIQRDTQINQAVLGSVGEHAQRSQDGEVPFLRLASSVSVVHQERIGRQLGGQRNGLLLSSSEHIS